MVIICYMNPALPKAEKEAVFLVHCRSNSPDAEVIIGEKISADYEEKVTLERRQPGSLFRCTATPGAPKATIFLIVAFQCFIV